MLKYRFIDDVYAADQYGSHILHSLERAQNFNRWMSDAIAPHVGARVLEIGAGIGNITSQLLPRDLYMASDINPNYIDYLRNLALGKPYLEVGRIDLEAAGDFADLAGRFDTVVCLNVLEHVRDPLAALRNIHGVLQPGGRAVVYVPQGAKRYSSLDEVLGHRCRYTRQNLSEELRATGFEVEVLRDFNRAGVPGWFLNGKLLRRRHFSRVQLKVFNVLVPLIRRLDRVFPWSGLGLIAVARRT
jgi:2-polyprenyl-3-methyl-5-hydroxy-6-metoxy-1,4-benzoquinol methylase